MAIGGDEGGGGVDRIRRFVAGTGIAAVVLVASVLGVRALSPDPDACDELLADVGGAGSFRWDNGMTASGAAWSAVLTDGIVHAAPDERTVLAAHVVADADGFDRLRRAADDELRPALDRLHALVIDPGTALARRDDPMVLEDRATVHRHVIVCGAAP